MCICGKISYSRKEAGTIVNKNTKGHRRTHAKYVPIRIYYCELCRCYHTTHMSLKEFYGL